MAALAEAAAEGDLEAAVARRLSGEPLAWILGRTTFCDVPVRVDHGVFVPRPQTEPLARRAARFFRSRGPTPYAADLCTGSGALARVLDLAAPDGVVIGTDCDAAAVACARANGVAAVRCRAGEALATGCFDLVTAVAPYVPTKALGVLPRDVQAFEPLLSLDGGDDGLVVVRTVIADASRLLRPGGRLYLELGDDEDERLVAELEAHRLVVVERFEDDEGDLRGLATTRV